MIKENDTLVIKDILLRPLARSDASAMYDIFSDLEAMEYWSTEAHTSLEETYAIMGQKYITGEGPISTTTWAITSCQNPNGCFGWISFFNFRPGICEFGYALHREHWGKGIMSSIMKPVIFDAYERFSLHRIEAQMHPNNIASRSLLLKTGFHVEGYLRKNFLRAGHFEDTLLMGLCSS